MSKKRKLETDIEDEWTPETEKEQRPLTKRQKIAQEKREKRADKKFINAFRKALQANPDGVPFRVTKRITKEEFKYLSRDIEVGELWYETGDPYSCCSRDGVMATPKPNHGNLDKDGLGCELPHSHISVELSVPYLSPMWRL